MAPDDAELDGHMTDSTASTTASSSAPAKRRACEPAERVGPASSLLEGTGGARGPEAPSWEAAGSAVEGAMEGLVAIATGMAGGVAGAVAAVGDAAAAALGEGSSVAGAVLALGEAAALAHSSLEPGSMLSMHSLTVSMPLKPSRASGADPGEHDPEPQRSAGPRPASLRRRLPSRGPGCSSAASRGAPAGAPQQAGGAGRRRVAILVNGSEGDVRPLIALAKALVEERGICVRVLTNANLVHRCIQHGIDAVPVFADSHHVMQKCGGLRGNFMEAVTKPARAAEKWMKDHEAEYVPVADALDAFAPHAIVAGSLVTGPCIRYEQATKVPVIPIFLSRIWLEEPALNVLVSLEPPRPSFFAISEVFDRRPGISARTMKTGAWALQEAPEVSDLSPGGPLHALRAFLDEGPPPVAVGWGSMLAHGLPPAEMLELALRALAHAGRRGVVLGGWAQLDLLAPLAASGRLPCRVSDGGKLAKFAAEQVCFVRSAPHAWLFPQCCCVIHHGGAGTAHAALRACRPAVVTPVCADQFAMAETISRLHAGVGFSRALPEISAKELGQAVCSALSNVTTCAAQTLGQRVLREEGQGVSRAAELIDGFLRGRIRWGQAGHWVKRLAAKKQHRQGP